MVFSPLDPVRLISSGFSIGQVWFSFVRGTKRELCGVSDAVSSESDLRRILCLRKRRQDQALGYEHSPAEPVFAFSFVQCQTCCRS